MIDRMKMGMIFAAVQNSPDAAELAKKLMILMIKRTYGFTKSTNAYLQADEHTLTSEMVADIYNGMRNMHGGNHKTILVGILKNLDIDYIFRFLEGNGHLSASLADREALVLPPKEPVGYKRLSAVSFPATADDIKNLRNFLNPDHPLIPYLK